MTDVSETMAHVKEALGKAFAVIVVIMVGVPLGIAMSCISLTCDDYPKYCSMSILLPCIGVLIDD